MSSQKRSTKANQQQKEEPALFNDDDDVTHYVDWTDLLVEDEEKPEKKVFNGENIVVGQVETKKSKQDPSISYSSVTLLYRYLTAEGEVLNTFIFELPELFYPYGVSEMESKGKINYSLMARFSKMNPVDMEIVDVFAKEMYIWFAVQTAENEWNYAAGSDAEFDVTRPASHLRNWIRYPVDKQTKRPMTDRDKQWYIQMLNTRDEKTQITAPFVQGSKSKPIPWNKLFNLPLYMFVTVQCASIYLGGGKVSPQFRAVSAVISKKPKRGGKVVNVKRANELAQLNPSLTVSINSVIDSVVDESGDMPEMEGNDKAGGFSSSVGRKSNDEEDELVLSVKPSKGKGMDALLNKARGKPNQTPSAKPKGSSNVASKGTSVVSRKPPATPAKQEDEYAQGDENEQYD